MDLKLDPLTHDLALDETGDVLLLDGIEAIAQQIRIRLLFVRGEWFLDRREGTPYVGEIWGEPADTNQLAAIFRQVVATTPGVLSVERLTVTFDDDTRSASVDFVARTEAGPLRSADFEPFIVEVG